MGEIVSGKNVKCNRYNGYLGKDVVMWIKRSNKYFSTKSDSLLLSNTKRGSVVSNELH